MYFILKEYLRVKKIAYEAICKGTVVCMNLSTALCVLRNASQTGVFSPVLGLRIEILCFIV